jgi:C_GCAxxG_C_C family probable redox protein
MTRKSEIAAAKFLERYNCAQSVFYAFSGDLGIDEESALKMACGFGAGMGRKEEVCGALAGGIMAIGSKYGRGLHDDRRATELTYAKTRELMDRFAEKHGSYICRTLLNGCELMTEEGQRQFKEQDLSNRVCNGCVQDVVNILEAMLSDEA